MRDAIGVYIHIPFCIRKCHYCDFLSFPADETEWDRYVASLTKEIIGNGNNADTNEKQWVDTVFIGGGTPSILPVSFLERIFSALMDSFHLSENAEITIECNPGTAQFEKLESYRKMGINRISFGIQSAVDTELKKLGRIHTFADAVTSFEMARAAGFENINADLMSAIPGQTVESYRSTLERVLALDPEHLSAYSLIVEEGTPFYEEYGENPPVDEDTDRIMYRMTKEILAGYGYRRYEVSNYAKDGFVCRHNMKYWSGGDYIGFGLGASSRIKHVRYKNETDFGRYMAGIQKKENIRYTEEVLQTEDEMSEFFVLGLRRTDGVSRQEFMERFSVDAMAVYGSCIQRFTEEGLLEISGDRIFFTDRGLDVSNYVLCHFV